MLCTRAASRLYNNPYPRELTFLGEVGEVPGVRNTTCQMQMEQIITSGKEIRRKRKGLVCGGQWEASGNRASREELGGGNVTRNRGPCESA